MNGQRAKPFCKGVSLQLLLHAVQQQHLESDYPQQVQAGKAQPRESNQGTKLGIVNEN